jgi:nucleotide-binding universal stress UspA family protein
MPPAVLGGIAFTKGTRMYRHILIATDGSELSNEAVKHGLELAHVLNAKVTALTVIVPWEDATLWEVAMTRSEAEYNAFVKDRAEKCLATVTDAAKAIGVACNAVTLKKNAPWEAIVETARSMKCDLVVMASHGWKGVVGLVLGSETQKVLTHCTVPVLVHRLAEGHQSEPDSGDAAGQLLK